MLFYKDFIAYHHLARLLIITKRMEHSLENMGAEGKGLWEKADSVEQYLPDGMMDNILKIADARNKAIHHNPKIDDINSILQQAKTISNQLKRISTLFFIKLVFKSHVSLKTKLEILVPLAATYMLLLIIIVLILKFSYLNAGLGGLFLVFMFIDFTFNLILGLIQVYAKKTFIGGGILLSIYNVVSFKTPSNILQGTIDQFSSLFHMYVNYLML